MNPLQNVFHAKWEHPRCPRDAESSFGPLVDEWCRSSDFTLMFEQTVLSILPAGLFLLCVPVRLYQLRGSSLKTLPNYLGAVKALTTVTCAILQLVLLVFWSLAHSYRTSASIPSAVFALVTSFAICYLSFVEHGRTIRPSPLLDLYLFITLVCDAIQVRTLHLCTDGAPIASVALASLCVKLVLLLLECQEKRSILRDPYRNMATEATSGVFSNAFLWWINPLLIAGNKKLLTPDDLPKTDDELSSERLRSAMQSVWDKRPKSEGRLTALFVMLRCIIWPFLDAILPRLVALILRYAQPFLIKRSISFVSGPRTERDDLGTGYGLIVAAVFIYVGLAVSGNIYRQRYNRLSVMVRGAMVGLIHNRSLTIQDGVFDDSAAVTLMSSDVDNVDNLCSLIHGAWANLLEVIIGFYLLSSEIGWASIMPLLLVIVNSQISAKVTSGVVPKLKKYKMSQQKRIAMTGAMLGSMKSMKMMGLSDTMEANVIKSRVQEIADYRVFRWMIVGFNAAANSLLLLTPSVTLVVFAIQAKLRGLPNLDINTAFTTIAIITMFTSPAAMLMTTIPNGSTLYASFSRIQKYLLEPSKDDRRLDIVKPPKILNGQKQNGKGNGATPDGDAGDLDNSPDETMTSPAIILNDVTVKPALTAEPALKDISLQFDVGSLNVVAGIVGSGKTTLVRSILGDLPPDSGTISVCSKRMAYCTQTAWLTNESIERIICGSSAKDGIDKTWYDRVVTACGLDEDLENLPEGDQSVIGSRGLTLSGGQRQRVALARAVYARMEIVLLDDVLSALDAKTEKQVVDKLLGPQGIFREFGTTVVLIMHATQYLPMADRIVVLNADGKIAEQGTWDDLRADAGYISNVILKGPGKEDDSEPEFKKSEKPKAAADPSMDTAQDLTRRTGDIAVYGYYFNTVGAGPLALCIVYTAAYAFCLSFPLYWLKWWAEEKGKHMGLYISVYLALGAGAILFNIGTIIIFLLVVAPVSGLGLHNKVLRTVMRAPQQFFAETDTGVTLNRFSQDMQLIDSQLPVALMSVSMQGFKIIGQVALLFSAEKFMGTTLPFCLIFVYFLQSIYLHTSRQLRFMDLEAKSPVYSHFLETLEGLATIRAFGWERQAIATNIERLDSSQRPLYAMQTIQQWLSLVLDLFVAALAVILVSLAVALRGTTTGGQVGIALNVVITANTVLLRMLESWTTLETSLGAISRIKTFESTTACEDKPGEDFEPSDDWPEKGAVEFRNVVASYNSVAHALRNLSMKVEPGQKVGVCGRTGSGKSSMLLTLLRLLDIESGTILIDGLDISTLPRETIRTRVIAIPQDSFILSDTVRVNTDPSGTVPDEVIVDALMKVHLWSVFQARSMSKDTKAATNGDAANGSNSAGGTAVTSGTATPTPASTSGTATPIPPADASSPAPANPLDDLLKSSPLSQGQQQLFNLSRALVRKHLNPAAKILILDEATSNVDSETDRLMQKIIREEFKTHTIITVAHRLDTILDADRIAVLELGTLVEFGEPKELLEVEGGKFRELRGE